MESQPKPAEASRSRQVATLVIFELTSTYIEASSLTVDVHQVVERLDRQLMQKRGGRLSMHVHLGITRPPWVYPT